MKVLFASDLHGKRELYETLFRTAENLAADLVILGGDLFPSWIPNPITLIRGTVEFGKDLDDQIAFLKDYLSPALSRFLDKHPDMRLLYIPGNHDWTATMDLFKDMLPDASCLHLREVILEGHVYIGYGCVTDSSFWVKDYVRRDTPGSSYVHSRYALVSSNHGLTKSENGSYALQRSSMEEELSSVNIQVPGKTICVFHCPPFDTGLDTLFDGSPIGSKAVRSFIERHQPLISLHGHIHEAPYLSGFFHTAIGKTIAINPGHGPAGLHAVLFDTEDPTGTLQHTIFGRSIPKRSDMSGFVDTRARRVKAYFMDTVLTKKQ
ncbi:MAG: metallophosphoesterase family protein [Desulfomonilia bacterium]